MVEPHSGQTQESSCQRWPALNQVTCGGLMPRAGSPGGVAAHTTSGSSAFATTRTLVCRTRAARQSCAIMATSLARSSWSRERLSSATTCGSVASSTWAR